VFYVDTFGKSIIQYNPRTDESEVMVLDELIGFAVPTSETTKSALRLIVGFEKDIVEVNFSKKQVMRTICSVTDDMMVMNGRFNGAKCSPHGYLYVNHLQITEKGLRERLFRLNLRAKDSFLTEVIDAVPVVMHDAKDKSGLHGMCWMTDARTNTLYRIENSVESSSIVAHVVTGDTMHGRMLHVGEKTTIYKLPSKQFLQGHRLNGITVDCKGKIWSAVLGGGCLLRVDPEIGKPSNIVYVPGTYPTGIIFCKYLFCI
jgi:sugar lactone lactonase YvrE